MTHPNLQPLRNPCLISKTLVRSCYRPFSAANEAKMRHFDIWPDLDQTFDLKTTLKSTTWEHWIAALPVSLWLLVRETSDDGAFRGAETVQPSWQHFHKIWAQKKDKDAQTLTIYLTELHPNGAGCEFLDRYPMTFCRSKAIFHNIELNIMPLHDKKGTIHSSAPRVLLNNVRTMWVYYFKENSVQAKWECYFSKLNERDECSFEI